MARLTAIGSWARPRLLITPHLASPPSIHQKVGRMAHIGLLLKEGAS